MMRFHLADLLKKNVKFSWSEAADKVVLDLRSRLASHPTFRLLDFAERFYMAIGALDQVESSF